ncbi:hypothetical protein [Microbacterium sp. P5_E9]
MSTQTEVRVDCENGHKKRTIARFATWGDPSKGSPVWWPEAGARQTFLDIGPYEDRVLTTLNGTAMHRTQTQVTCPHCTRSLSARGATLDDALTELARDGARRIDFGDLITSATSAASN